jgi:hypothetical protein
MNGPRTAFQTKSVRTILQPVCVVQKQHFTELFQDPKLKGGVVLVIYRVIAEGLM